MNILLCMPDVLAQYGDYSTPPIGIAYISAVLKSRSGGGGVIHTLNFVKEQRPIHDALCQIINDCDIDIIMCGDLVVNYKKVKEILDAAKSVKPDIITVTGGGLVTYSPIEAMTIVSSADYGVIGEAEITICELVDALETKSDVSKVSGIVYRSENGELVITNERGDVPDLDALPFPDYEGFLGKFVRESRTASIVTSRSCPYSCTYCSHSGGKKYRTRSMDSVFSEIDFLVENYDVTSLFLRDELFSAQQERLVEFCSRIMDYNLKWFVCLRISDSLTLDILRLMKKSGCRQLFYGLESADDRILKSMKKGTTVAMMERCLSRTKASGILQTGIFIFGDPEEDEESVNNTLRWIDNHRDFFFGTVKCMPIILYPGSPLYNDAVRNGVIDPLTHILNDCPHVNVSKLSDEYFAHLLSEVFHAETEKASLHSNTADAEIKFRVNGNETYEISIMCPNCSQEYTDVINANVLSTVGPWPYEYDCAHCNHNEKVSLIPAYVSWIDDLLLDIIEKHNCAIWPPSIQYMKVYECSDVLKHHEDKYELIDSDIKLNTFHGKKIHAPDFLNSGEVSTAIIFSGSYVEIDKEIRARYPHIKPIIFHEIAYKKYQEELT